MTREEVSCTIQIICVVPLQLLSDLMQNSWSFFIGVGALTYRLGHAHLDTRILLPPTQLRKLLMSSHLMATIQ